MVELIFKFFSEKLEQASRNLTNENKLKSGLAFPTGKITLMIHRLLFCNHCFLVYSNALVLLS